MVAEQLLAYSLNDDTLGYHNMNEKQFEGKVALITGSASGLGKSIAILLAQRAAQVAILDMQESAAQALVEEIRASGGTAKPYTCDITSTEQVNRVVQSVVDAFGGIDLLVNNAGIGDDSTAVDQMTDEQWDRMLDVHLSGTFRVTRAAVPSMKKRGGGSIVIMSSQSGMVGEPNFCHYCAAKAGLMGFTKALAKELAPFHISVNAVAPGVIETSYFIEYSKEEMDKKRALVPLGRLGKPEDVAFLTAFLLSARADYITGQVISPNGGRTIVGI